MTIGATIRQLRQEQDITQEELAEALGITSRAVSQWECGRTAPDISQLPALANFFHVTTDRLLGVDIKRKDEEIAKIIKHSQKFGEHDDWESTVKFLREKVKLYPNEPKLLTHLAFALQVYYFHQGKADTQALRAEKSSEIISLCERALRYYKPTDDNSSPKQVLIRQYIEYLHDKEKAREMVMALPTVTCTREMFMAELYEGKKALECRQQALLWSFSNMLHNIFWNIAHDDSYTYEQKIEILQTDDTITELITGDKPNFFHGKLSINAAMQAVWYLRLGEKEKALDRLEAAYSHADKYENRTDGEKYAPCWLSELDDKHMYVQMMDSGTTFDNVYNVIMEQENGFFEVFAENERFVKLMEKLREKIG